MHCYACEKEAGQQCQRCGRLYCDDHGDNLCGECLNPASAVPSPTIYRGSLLALVAGTAIVIWLLLAPPALPGDAVAIREPEASTERPPAETVEEPQEEATVTPDGAEPTAEATTSASPQATAPAEGTCPEGTTASGEQCVYTVVAGDTVSTIAVRFGISEAALTEANALSGEPLQIGQALVIPSP